MKTHMETLSSKYEQLKGMGEKLKDDDFTMLILASLSKGYCLLINMISLQNHTSTTPLKPQVIIEMILEEFVHLQIKESQLKATENAMVAKGGKGKGKKPRKGTGLTSWVYACTKVNSNELLHLILDFMHLIHSFYYSDSLP